jgi:hypothetical protein
MDTLAETSEYVVKNVLKQFPGGQRVMDKLGEIGTGVSAIYNNPGRFVDTLCKSVNDGFGLFTKNLPENLQNSAIGVITGSLSGTGLVLPKELNATGFLDIGLQVLGVSPQQLENKVAKGVPGGLQAIQAVGEAKDVFDGIRNNGVLATIKSYYENSEGIRQVIIDGLKSWAINTVAKKAIAVLGSLFIPGGGLVQLAIKIYDTITFVLDKMEMISNTLASITKSFASIANGDASQATTGIVDTLKGGLTLALGFMVKISGLGGITDKVKKLLADLKKPVDRAIAKLIGFIKSKLSGRAKPAPSAPAGTPGTATGTGKEPKSLNVFKAFASKFGVDQKKILSFTDDKTSDDSHDEKVARGLNALETEEQKYFKDDKISIEDAQKAAAYVKQNHSVFKSIKAVTDDSAGKITYNWTASAGSHSSAANLRRPPYTDDLEPDANEGTASNPFPLDWGKPASANYPTIYLGGKRNRLPLSQRFVSQSDLKNKVGEKDDQNVEIKAYTPQNQETLSGGEKLGLSPNYYLSVGSLIGPLSAKGITTPGGRKITDVLKRYGFNPSAENMDGDHIHEIQTGGSDVLENLWMLDSAINQAAGGKLDRTEIVLKSGAKPKLFQLREYVEKTNRKVYFKIKSTL